MVFIHAISFCRCLRSLIRPEGSVTYLQSLDFFLKFNRLYNRSDVLIRYTSHIGKCSVTYSQLTFDVLRPKLYECRSHPSQSALNYLLHQMVSLFGGDDGSSFNSLTQICRDVHMQRQWLNMPRERLFQCPWTTGLLLTISLHIPSMAPFDPQKDLPDLTGRVALITGATQVQNSIFFRE